MEKTLLVFLLIFEQTLVAQQAANQPTVIQQGNSPSQEDHLLTNATSNKSDIAMNKGLKFRTLIDLNLVKNWEQDGYPEDSYSDLDNTNTNKENLIIKNLISDGNIIFDVGANVGDWTNQVLLNHKDTCIFSFEPLHFLAESMKERFKDKKVKIYESAVFSEEKTIIFNYYEKWPQSSSIYPQNWLTTWLQEPKKISVKTVCLDKFCTDNKINHIDFLKIDVEGSELDVLKGSSDLLKKHAVDFIQFTYNRAYFGAQIRLKQMYDLLASFKYYIFKEYADGLVYIPQWDDSLENYRRSNYIAIANFDPSSTRQRDL